MSMTFDFKGRDDEPEPEPEDGPHIVILAPAKSGKGVPLILPRLPD